MTKSKTEYFSTLLQQRLDELLVKAGNTVKGLADLKWSSPELLEQVSLDTERDYALRLRERESRLIAKINDALNRLEEGTFGICEECEEEIAEERLMVRPVATLCIDCKKKQEFEEKKRGI